MQMHFISLIISFCGKQLLKWHLRATRVKNKPPVDLIGGTVSAQLATNGTGGDAQL